MVKMLERMNSLKRAVNYTCQILCKIDEKCAKRVENFTLLKLKFQFLVGRLMPSVSGRWSVSQLVTRWSVCRFGVVSGCAGVNCHPSHRNRPVVGKGYLRTNNERSGEKIKEIKRNFDHQSSAKSYSISDFHK